MQDVERLVVPVSMPFCGASVEMGFPVALILMVPHAHACGAQGRTVGIESDTALIEEVRKCLLAVFRKRDNRNDLLLFEILIMRVGVVVTIATRCGCACRGRFLGRS